MSLNYNEVNLAGRLTADPELKTTSNGVSVTTVTVAVDRPAAKEGADKITDFFCVTAWRQTADFLTRYFRKGSAVFVHGALQTRVWQDQNGNKRKETEVLADRVYFVESKANSGAQTPEPAAPAPSPTAPTPAPVPEPYTGGQQAGVEPPYSAHEEDLPF